MAKIFRFTKIAFVFVAICSISFCSKNDSVQTVDADVLFSLNYGNFENQMNLFDITDVGTICSSLAMRDGFFYIVNGESQKIMSFNSYGDILSLYYGVDHYSGAKAGIPEHSTASIWHPVNFPFQFCGNIAVDKRKYMYLSCLVPRDRREMDDKENLLYSHVILRVSSDGSTLDYIGQQGPGGTPFPFIKNVYVTENDELVVVCTVTDGLRVFWFSSNGFLKYKIFVGSKDVPLLSKDEGQTEDYHITIENAVPDSYRHRLYVKADYYLPSYDAESKALSSIDFISSVVHPMDVENGTYSSFVDIPASEEVVSEDFNKIIYRMPYDFIGSTKNGWLFFATKTLEGFAVQMVHPETQYVIKRNFVVDHKNTLFYSLSLSPEGIISAILADKENVKVVWWRTDNIIESVS